MGVGAADKQQQQKGDMDEESEVIHEQLLGREVDVAAFFQKHKKLRVVYHGFKMKN
ncbi:modifier of rudimentary, Modr [Artemisia annua]|uniref:Modifier of rudimentary, Modr n=1 Tax=Artemisia annua TaxID=35608 RepID=A0A2U1KZE0_ARTAN|nr:modifier of rudimentary, Modr [Artemisia annua]